MSARCSTGRRPNFSMRHSPSRAIGLMWNVMPVAANAARLHSLIRPASNSATDAICVSRNRPMAPAGTLGRSQKNEVGTARHKGTQKVDVARQSIELGEDQGRTDRLCARQCLSQHRAIRALAGSCFDILGFQKPPATVEIAGDRCALGIEAQAASILSIGSDAQIGNVFATCHDRNPTHTISL